MGVVVEVGVGVVLVVMLSKDDEVVEYFQSKEEE